MMLSRTFLVTFIATIIVLTSCKSVNIKDEHKADLPKEIALDDKQLESIIDILKHSTQQPMISLTAERKPTSVYSSKLGGIPYLPPNFEYPHYKNATNGPQPLKLLAQINFSEMPKTPHFPEKGILQFYISYDDVFGINFDNLCEQTSFRVIYHENIIEDLSLLQTPPELPSLDEFYFPFEGEFLLTGVLKNGYITSTDYRFEELFIKTLNDITGFKIEHSWDISEENYEKLNTDFNGQGHRIGGYPFFTQWDPRSKESNSDVLLLQIDSQFNNNYEIIWGDAGVANFFISPIDLENLDFSNVMYTWDCY